MRYYLLVAGCVLILVGIIIGGVAARVLFPKKTYEYVVKSELIPFNESEFRKLLLDSIGLVKYRVKPDTVFITKTDSVFMSYIQDSIAKIFYVGYRKDTLAVSYVLPNDTLCAIKTLVKGNVSADFQVISVKDNVIVKDYKLKRKCSSNFNFYTGVGVGLDGTNLINNGRVRGSDALVGCLASVSYKNLLNLSILGDVRIVNDRFNFGIRGYLFRRI